MEDTDDGMNEIRGPVGPPPPSPPTPSDAAELARRGKARRFIDLIGLAALPEVMVANLVENFGAVGTPRGAVIEKALRAKIGDLVENFVTIYAEHLPTDVLDQLIAYQESPAGRYLNEVGPKIHREIADAGDAWQSSVMTGIKDQLVEPA